MTRLPAIVDTTFDKYVTKTIKSTDKDGSIQSIKPDFPALSLSACKNALQLTAEDAANVLTIASRLSPDYVEAATHSIRVAHAINVHEYLLVFILILYPWNIHSSGYVSDNFTV